MSPKVSINENSIQIPVNILWLLIVPAVIFVLIPLIVLLVLISHSITGRRRFSNPMMVKTTPIGFIAKTVYHFRTT